MEDLDDAHRAAAARTWFAQGERGGLGDLLRVLHDRSLPEQFTDVGDVGLAGGAGEQAVVADAVEAVRQDKRRMNSGVVRCMTFCLSPCLMR